MLAPVALGLCRAAPSVRVFGILQSEVPLRNVSELYQDLRAVVSK